ncbi:MAG: DNA primase [Pseudomonadota bacterium]
MSFPRQFIQDLQDRLVLSEIIGKRVKITRAGRDEFKACCPFHNEKTPSFTLNNQKGFYHCFGCGAHGDAIKFVQEHDNLNFLEAVELLAGQAGMQVPQASPEDRKRFERQKTLYDLLEEVTLFFERHLPQNREASEYLKGRGLSPETIKTTRLGYAPADPQALITLLLDKGYRHKDMVEAGVVRPSTRKEGEFFSFFRDRVMFPVTDLRGRVVAFGGRIMPSNSGGNAPKYINSSDTPLFHKGQILYNLSNARAHVGPETPYIIVEGYMDVIALSQAGYKTAVAPLGTALTESQIAVLWKTAPPDARVPVLCFDGDNAGRRAASRALERIMPMLQPDQSVRFAFLPEGEDPDSLIQKEGREAFETFLQAGEYLSSYLWTEELSKRPGQTPEDRAGLKTALLSRVKEIEDANVQREYARMMMERFENHFRASFAKKGGQRYFKSFRPEDRLAPVSQKPAPIRPSAFGTEHYLLAAIVNYPELFDEFEEILGTLPGASSDLQNFRQSLFDVMCDKEALDSSELKDILESMGYGTILDALLSESLYLQAVFARPEQDITAVREGCLFTVERARKRRRR